MTRLSSIRWGIAVLAALILPLLLAWLGLFRWLGAHPWWDIKTALIGAPIGTLIAALLFSTPRVLRVGIAVLVIVLAYYFASTGKAVFAESFGDDAIAGKHWYFGWIGIGAGLAALILSVLSPARR